MDATLVEVVADVEVELVMARSRLVNLVVPTAILVEVATLVVAAREAIGLVVAVP